MQPQHWFRASLLASLPLLLAGSSSADVLRVSPFGQGDHSTIQEAVDAAQNGDLIWVGTGDYPGFTMDGKSLKLIVSPGAQVLVTEAVNVINLPAGGTLVIDGLEVRPLFDTALYATSNLGHVRFEDCQFFGASTWDAAQLDTNPSIAFTRCTLMGGYGAKTGFSSLPAGNGVTSMTSAVMFYDCLVKGGDGATTYTIPPSDGGYGCSTPDWGIIASNTTFIGGDGGNNDDFIPWGGGHGGDGLIIGVNARAELLDNVTQGGAGGHDCCGGTPGTDGEDITGGGPLHVYPEIARAFEAQASIVPAGRTLQVSVEGQPGDSVYLPLSNRTTYIFKPSFFGIWLVPQRSIIPWSVWPTGTTVWPLPLGVIPASGNLTVGVRMPDPPPGETSHDVFLQGYILDPTGRPILGSLLQVFVPECSAQLPDCDNNGLFDGCDIALGIDPDCGANGIPDVCDPDCNANSISDNCEISQGAPDCNVNGIPDFCEPDCNTNSVADECDISTGSSPDLNSNGIPDECEVSGQTWYVDSSAPAGGDGSQLNPYQSIGEAIAPSLPGDEIRVADGTYKGIQNRGLTFGGRDLVLRSINGPVACIIDLQDSDRALWIRDGETRAARIEGFTFRNGLNPDVGPGGAIRVLNSSPTISDCVFEDNTSDDGGGAVGCSGGLPLIEDCVFTNNLETAVSFNVGGGAFRGSAHLVRCTFTGNVSSYGGAVRIISTASNQSVVSHCSFIGNTSNEVGGALAVYGNNTPTISNCLFVGNVAGQDGGAIIVQGSGGFTTNAKLVNLTIVHNEAFGGVGSEFGGAGGGVIVRSRSDATLENCIVRENSSPLGPQIAIVETNSILTIAHTLTQDIYTDGLGSFVLGANAIDTDPAFVDIDGPDDDPATIADNDYHLGTESPAVDSGDNAAVAADTVDLDADANTTEPEPFDLDELTRFADDPGVADTGSGTPPLVDMGCFER